MAMAKYNRLISSAWLVNSFTLTLHQFLKHTYLVEAGEKEKKIQGVTV